MTVLFNHNLLFRFKLIFDSFFTRTRSVSKNRYIFRKNTGYNRNGYHHYLVHTDKYARQNVAVETTHLYNKDLKRLAKLKIGKGIKMSLPGMETPSMVTKKTTPEGVVFEKSRLKAKASSLSTRKKPLLPIFIRGVGKYILTQEK